MLSYQHGYHAGNFADVIKHLTLTRLLCYLTLKDKPLFYLETHSGAGLYDLKNKQAEKTKEYQHGIQLLWSHEQSLNPLFKDYLNIINQLNPAKTLRYYPGSPYLATNLLRMQDRMYFCELHPREFEVLTQLPRFNKKVHFSRSDGVLALKALLPPPEKRGLIFIDPSFEIKEEYKEIPIALKQAYSRFSTGVYCLWYPLVDKKLTDRLNRGMKDINIKNTLHLEFSLTANPIEGMYGCGLWIINPPFTLAEEMKTVLTTLKRYFNPEGCFFHIEAN
ncbi:23S rRNA (adenine(2030)-N(6))-methyltransferase RlmJ [Legionella longbeachae]|uniref:Ribosomal RNA large subunit methyltransferase J n=1 Tax=Legionella longbeachae serogroup 1 (strain NSW150) TaxID=661367 RepID=D3HRJ3_LEGLN|nr:23S rRNA (adenine(2030)-N(6))-methyltransferase RlmJ [Legionella longbeachae]VEE02025.1 protein involved in catabolism of external DNA [Legionella oakridgensis]HBD7396725.1 23S rRNA (adenine(2030)-N(6))-methyltransferase RlmJ [Legionella pneumophila]ARB91668.1 23S rRNA (adenine(2030)-N(6))-methyltransferase RlmJ [Legionella longbeachae]ARM35188.1 23S rRNA (adenine(2030)-N(6))-methyltransferase RlmJ [Legionella longbeachae]QIN31914.1 23S rRNA (adenine(2030)-N(6))-methyltransferase RlmJ [Legi